MLFLLFYSSFLRFLWAASGGVLCFSDGFVIIITESQSVLIALYDTIYNIRVVYIIDK